MKKINIFLLGAFAVAATSSCDEAPAVPPMQETPQETILADGDITGASAGVLASDEVLNLEALKNTPSVEVFRFTEIKDLPEGASTSCELQLSGSETFDNVKTLQLTMADGVAYANVVDWNEAHMALFGKSPKEKTAWWRVPVFVTLDGTTYRYNSPDWYGATGTVKETCMDVGFVIYDAYYMLGNGTTWDLAQASGYKFDHSDKDVYDDPVFTYVMEVTQDVLDANGGGCYWKIASQKALETGDWAYVFGPEVDGDDNLSGMLTDTNPGAGKLTEAGKYRFTVNMESMSYDIEKLVRPEYVAVPSKANGWNESGPWLYWTNNDSKPYFCGVAAVNNTDGGFKFIWDGGWYGGADGKIDAAGGNIPAPVDATRLYWFTVSTENLTYTMTEVETLGVIGGGNWDVQRNLTPSDDYLTWEGDVEISGEWKIRMNDNWDYNYGGEMSHAVFDGSNFNCGDGNFHVKVDFTGHFPVVTATAK